MIEMQGYRAVCDRCGTVADLEAITLDAAKDNADAEGWMQITRKRFSGRAESLLCPTCADHVATELKKK